MNPISIISVLKQKDERLWSLKKIIDQFHFQRSLSDVVWGCVLYMLIKPCMKKKIILDAYCYRAKKTQKP